MTPEMIGRQENTNQKRRMELTLDLIEAVALDGQQRDRIREIRVHSVSRRGFGIMIVRWLIL
jgi:hypothetical protein